MYHQQDIYMKEKFTHIPRGGRSRFPRLLLICIYLAFLASCEREKVTIIYGTVTDQNKQPVDSIFVIVQGMQLTKIITTGEAITDTNGNYSVTIISKKLYTPNVAIPFWAIQNPKLVQKYKGFHAKKNDENPTACCTAIAGKKTKYDFELISK